MSFFIGVPTRGSCCAIDNTAMLAEVSEIISVCVMFSRNSQTLQ
jgi:hypothetical protein